MTEWADLAEEPDRGRLHLPIGEDLNSPLSGQCMAAVHTAEAGETRPYRFRCCERPTPVSRKKQVSTRRLASDQRGHGIGVSLDVYTSSDL
jgi:hypothetical protein